MTKIIDTHAHIYLKDFEEDIEEVITNSKESGIEHIFMPNINSATIDRMLRLEERFNDYCIPMMGLHPCYVKDDYKKELNNIETWLKKRDFCAVGEIGIDLYWDKTFISEQKKAFEIQVQLAKDLEIPIIIHCRDSIDMTIDLVEKHQDGKLTGIFHCFTGQIEQAHRIIDLGFLLGIGGVVTFKNGGLDKIVGKLDLANMVLETDSPYLAPTPFRGKRNKPQYINQIANKVAELQDCELSKVAKTTSENALSLFRHEKSKS